MTTEQVSLSAPSASWAEQADLMARVARVLALEVELERLLPQIVGLATEVLVADRSSLFLYDRDRDELWGRVAQGLGTREIRLPARAGLAGAARGRRSPLLVADAYTDPRFDRRWDEQTGYRTRSVLVVPITNRANEPLGVLQVMNKRSGGPFAPTDAVLADAFASHVAVALERALLTEAYADRRRMQVALDAARRMQRSLLPGAPPASDAVDVAGYLAPAELVGGDFYDYFDVDAQRFGFAIGEGAGRGLSAALQTASVQTLIRSHGLQGMPPARCLDLVRQARRGDAALYASLIYGVLDTRTGHLTYANAGHAPPIRLRTGHTPVRLDRDAGETRLLPGDSLMLLSRGVVEARARDREPFGEERLLDVLGEADGERPEAVLHRLLAALEAFAGLGEGRDDLAALVLRFDPGRACAQAANSSSI